MRETGAFCIIAGFLFRKIQEYILNSLVEIGTIMVADTNHFMAFKQGSERAFQVFYEKYYHAMCLWVLRIIKDDALMHDFVQEAFIALWNSRDSIENELHLKMFLYQTVRNRCLNFLKNKKVEEKYIREYLKFGEEIYFESSVIEEEVYRLVIEEIQALPDEQKKVVKMHLEGKNNLEIAEVMQVSVNTVKTHKARARRTLKYRLGDLFLIALLFN